MKYVKKVLSLASLAMALAIFLAPSAAHPQEPPAPGEPAKVETPAAAPAEVKKEDPGAAPRPREAGITAWA